MPDPPFKTLNFANTWIRYKQTSRQSGITKVVLRGNDSLIPKIYCVSWKRTFTCAVSSHTWKIKKKCESTRKFDFIDKYKSNWERVIYIRTVRPWLLCSFGTYIPYWLVWAEIEHCLQKHLPLLRPDLRNSNLYQVSIEN
jgi:hypothetical protein